MSNEQETIQALAVELESHPAFQFFKRKITEGHRTPSSVLTMSDNQLSRMYAFEAGVMELFRLVEVAANSEVDLTKLEVEHPFEHYGNETENQ